VTSPGRALLAALALAAGCGGRGAATPAGETGASTDSADSPDDSGAAGAECPQPDPPAPAPGAAPLLALDPAPSNLLMISLDTLRRDALGRYGGADTPFLDDLLARSVVLDDHRSCSNWTLPSMLCAFTGRGFMGSTSAETLGPMLADAGFEVGYAITNTWLYSVWPDDPRFELTLDEPQLDGESLVEQGLPLLAQLQDGGGRWFFQIHFYDPHAPYDPPERYLGALEGLAPIVYDLSTWEGVVTAEAAWLEAGPEEKALLEAHARARYEAEIAWLDDTLETLWAGLEAQGALEDTLVLVLTDHGEQLWERGADDGILQHGGLLYQEESGGTAAFWARSLPPAAWTEPTSHADLLPTVLDALGVDAPADLEGLPVGTAAPDRPRFATGVKGYVHQSVDLADRRLIYRWEGEAEVYDRTVPGETEDLWDPADPESLALWQALEPWVEAMACEMAGSVEPVYPEGVPAR
jgi:arylsulfatase A-like enzyme